MSSSSSAKEMLRMMGRITLVTGPMFGAKSSHGLYLMEREQRGGRKCVVVKSTKDTRSGDASLLITHNNVQMRADIVTDSLRPVKDKCLAYDVIFVDEGQFFPDLAEVCDEWATHHNKLVIVAALNSTFERKPWPQVALLMAYAEVIVKLNAVCENCPYVYNDQYATFSALINDDNHRKDDDDDKIIIGGEETFKSLCRKCYHDNARCCSKQK